MGRGQRLQGRARSTATGNLPADFIASFTLRLETRTIVVLRHANYSLTEH